MLEPLSIHSTEDLLKELLNRFDAGFFAGTTEAEDAENQVIVTATGNAFTVLGLLGECESQLRDNMHMQASE